MEGQCEGEWGAMLGESGEQCEGEWRGNVGGEWRSNVRESGGAM